MGRWCFHFSFKMYAATSICCSRLICNSVCFPNTPHYPPICIPIYPSHCLHFNPLLLLPLYSMYPVPIYLHFTSIFLFTSRHFTSPPSPPPSFSYPLTSPHLPHLHLFFISPHLSPHLPFLIPFHPLIFQSPIPSPHLPLFRPLPSPARCAPSPPART